MWSHEGCADCYRYDLKPKWPHPHIHSQHKNLTIGIVTTIVPKTQNCSTHPISSSRHAPSAEAGASYQASCCSRPRCSHPENKSLINKFLIIESPTLKKMFSCCNFCFPCGIPTSSMILVFKVGVLLQQLGKVLEQAVLRSEKVKLEVPLLPERQH